MALPLLLDRIKFLCKVKIEYNIEYIYIQYNQYNQYNQYSIFQQGSISNEVPHTKLSEIGKFIIN